MMNTLKLSERSIEIAFKEEGQGMPVMLLHGFCGSSAYWNDIVPLLAPHYRLIVPDLPGHGQSGVPNTPYPIEAYADDLAELLRLLNVKEAVWLGHSLGGYITLAAAERHADLVSAFGLIHSTAFPDDDKGKSNRLRSIETILDSGIVPFVDGLIPKLFAPDHIDSMPHHIDDAKKIGYATPPDGAIAALKAMLGRPDRNSVLAHAACPILLLAGENDQLIKPEKTFSVHNQSIKQVVLEHAGHMSMIEAPNHLAEVLLAFLQQTSNDIAKL